MSTYSNLSPYYNTSVNGAYLDVITFREIPSEANDVKFEVTAQYEYRPDLLAYDLYGDSNLWWVFAMRNVDKIKDPIYDLYAGQTIFLPKLSSLKSALGF